MPNVSFRWGSQTFARASSKINVFAMRADGTHNRDFPGKALPDTNRKNGVNPKTPASVNDVESHGCWYAKEHESINGVIICVQATTNVNGAPYNAGATFIRLDADGPYIRVRVLLRPSRDARFNQIDAFMGRGHILDPEELPSYGVKLTRSYLDNYTDGEEIEELFVVEELSEGCSKPQIVNVRMRGGESKSIALPTEVRRKLRVRKS